MEDEVFRMQQEAAQRVHRMQEHARRLIQEDQEMTGSLGMGSSSQPKASPSAGGRTAASLAAARTPILPPERRTASPPQRNPSALPYAPHPPASSDTKPTSEHGGLLASLGKDPEQLLLLLLAVLLIQNHADPSLILALLYLAM